VAITVDDPREQQLPPVGWVLLQDAESGREVFVDAGSARVREAAARKAALRTADRARVLLSSGVDQLALTAGQDYAPVLHRAFAARAKRMRR
jgi:hypothetical protein